MSSFPMAGSHRCSVAAGDVGGSVGSGVRSGDSGNRNKVVNIEGVVPVEDAHYRYKIPLLEAVQERTKTIVRNLDDVARALHRPTEEVMRFFAVELCAKASYNSQESDASRRAVIRGRHDGSKVRSALRGYVEAFVLCPTCRLPETAYCVRRSTGVVSHKCFACGCKAPVVLATDACQKLSTFIFAEYNKSRKTGKMKKEKERLERNRVHGRKGHSESGKGLETKAQKIETKAQKNESKFGRESQASKKRECSSSYLSHEKDCLSLSMKSMAVDGGSKGQARGDSSDDDQDDEVEVGLDSAVKGTWWFMKENPKATVEEVTEVVTNRQLSCGLPARDRVRIIIRAVCALTPESSTSESTRASAEDRQSGLSRYTPVLRKLVNDNHTVEVVVINAIAEICPGQPKHFPILLAQLYDHDVFNEESILEWAESWNPAALVVGSCTSGSTGGTVLDQHGDDCSRGEALSSELATLRRYADSFITWLKEAESEGESDD